MNSSNLRAYSGGAGIFLKGLNITINGPTTVANLHNTSDVNILADLNRDDDFCNTFQSAIAILIGVICILGILSNILSLCVLSRYKGDVESVFLLKSLTISDLLLLLTTIVVYTPPAFGIPLNSDSAIFLYIWPIAMMTHTTTIWIIVMLSYNRFTAVCRLGQHGESSCSSLLAFTSVIVFAIIFNIPRFFEHRPLYFDNELDSTSNNSSIQRDTSVLGDIKVYQIVYSNILYYPVMFIVPLSILIFLNTKLISTLKDIKRKRRVMTGHKSKDDHVTLIIIVVVSMFIFCQTPALINQIFWAFFDNDFRDCGRFHYFYTRISDVMVIFNSAINFAIYCLFGKAFRRLFFATIFCHKVPNNNLNDQSTKQMLKQSSTVL